MTTKMKTPVTKSEYIAAVQELAPAWSLSKLKSLSLAGLIDLHQKLLLERERQTRSNALNRMAPAEGIWGAQFGARESDKLGYEFLRQTSQGIASAMHRLVIHVDDLSGIQEALKRYETLSNNVGEYLPLTEEEEDHIVSGTFNANVVRSGDVEDALEALFNRIRGVDFSQAHTPGEWELKGELERQEQIWEAAKARRAKKEKKD